MFMARVLEKRIQEQEEEEEEEEMNMLDISNELLMHGCYRHPSSGTL
jgi:hypothetical protein